MKQLFTLLAIIVLFNTSKASAMENVFPFDVKVSGQGKQSIIFIPGFACSGNVWKETVLRYEKTSAAIHSPWQVLLMLSQRFAFHYV